MSARHARMRRCLWLLLAGTQPALYAAEVEVRIAGSSATGQLVCALFGSEAGFPTDPGAARRLRATATPGDPICEFHEVPAGQWAVAVLADANANGCVDTSFLGVPTEAWGVSGNLRPSLRAPRFSEAAFTLEATQRLALAIKVAE